MACKFLQLQFPTNYHVEERAHIRDVGMNRVTTWGTIWSCFSASLAATTLSSLPAQMPVISISLLLINCLFGMSTTPKFLSQKSRLLSIREQLNRPPSSDVGDPLSHLFKSNPNGVIITQRFSLCPIIRERFPIQAGMNHLQPFIEFRCLVRVHREPRLFKLCLCS